MKALLAMFQYYLKCPTYVLEDPRTLRCINYVLVVYFSILSQNVPRTFWVAHWVSALSNNETTSNTDKTSFWLRPLVDHIREL